MGFKYEMHAHTKYSSGCSNLSADEIVDFYLLQNYTGLFVTDHFFNGNNCNSKERAWKYRVEEYCEAYEKVKVVGDKRGLDVFFGLEYTSPQTFDSPDRSSCSDFLVLGIDKEWIIDHGGDVDVRSTGEYLGSMREAGGTVIQAHPFRLEQNYMTHIALHPLCTDGVEILNCNPNTMGVPNIMANHYADEYGFFKTAGTDIHSSSREKLAVTELPTRVKNVAEFVEALKSRKQNLYIADSYYRKIEKR